MIDSAYKPKMTVVIVQKRVNARIFEKVKIFIANINCKCARNHLQKISLLQICIGLKDLK